MSVYSWHKISKSTWPSMVKSKYHRRLFNMTRKKEVYRVKPLNENKKNIRSA